ncbi:hypothetical protein ATCC90586_003900 [Pythium insidiosum]|nr:hypothetical protein ATCC90586_003900 [Pythium insidiosum]
MYSNDFRWRAIALLHVYGVNISTICRALNFDLNLSRKVLTKAARECVPYEVENYKAKLEAIYSYPQQLLFIDETSKDGRHAYRRYAWSKRNTPVIVKLPFRRGKRVSILAALDCQGFVSWETTPGTFTRRSFHEAFIRKVLPLLNPWPLPRSIVVIDNAKIHMYQELEKNVILWRNSARYWREIVKDPLGKDVVLR